MRHNPSQAGLAAEHSDLSLAAEGRQVYRKQAMRRNPEHAELITGRQENNAGQSRMTRSTNWH